MSTPSTTVASLLADLDPARLDADRAEAAFVALQAACKRLHTREAVAGRVAMRGFCVCGYRSVGNGGKLCAALWKIPVISDPAAWCAAARELGEALIAAGEP